MIRERLSTSSSEVSEARQRVFPVAAVAALALVAIIEVGLVWGNRHRIWDANYILLEKKREALSRNTRSDDVAILGSSRFYHIDPAVVEQAFGKDINVTNYSWGWCSVEAYEGMLRGLIQGGRTPKLVIVDSIPEIFAYDTKWLTIEQFDGFRIGFTETVPFGAAVSTTLNHGQWATCWQILTHYMSPPSMLYREGIKRLYTTWRVTGKVPKRPPEYKRLVAAWEQKGWFVFVNPPDRVAPEKEFKDLEQSTGPFVFRPNKNIARLYESFLQLAHEHNIRVIMIGVANNPWAYKRFMDNGIFSAYDTWLNTLEARYPQFSAPGPRYFTWPGFLGDAGHLNSTGISRHLDLVKDVLEKELKPAAAETSETLTN